MAPQNNLPPILQDLLHNDEKVIQTYEHPSRKTIHYIITNIRIINCKRIKNIKSYYYSSLFKIEAPSSFFGSSIFLHTQPDIDINEGDSYLGLITITDLPKEAGSIIRDAWFPQSPYSARIKPFKQLAKKYNLDLKPIELYGNNIILMNGIINDLKMTLSLSNIFKLNQFHIYFDCPNSENNFLSIVPEKTIDGISKLFGKQDIITKDKPFDKRFLLQSDHQRFFDFVVTPEIRKDLYTASNYIDCNIRFGLKKEKEKRKRNNKTTEFDILDEHLLDELIPVTEHDDDLFSSLSFEANSLREKLFNIDIVIAYSIQYFEVVLKIATRIKEYNEMHKS